MTARHGVESRCGTEVNYGAGTLTIAARRSGARTILERVRYDGISRCSRAFAYGDAALVVLSQLGPGVVRGDSVATTGHVRAGAHLIVTSQSATRLMGGSRASRAGATWRVDDGAVLELVGEPLVAGTDARYEMTTEIELGAGALALVSDIAAVAAGAAVCVRTSVRQGDCELLYDAYDAASAAPAVVGTFAVVGASASRLTALVSALDEIADAASAPNLRIGIGSLATGGFARILADDIWAVRSLLLTLRDATRSALGFAAPG